ncbi:MAG: putative baseplate assembly protein, partial [Chloroflexota bacterium]
VETSELYRVLTVTPEPEAGRTRITIQPWQVETVESTEPLPPPPVSLLELIERYAESGQLSETKVIDEVKKFGISPESKVVLDDVKPILNTLVVEVKTDLPFGQLLEKLAEVTGDLTGVYNQLDLRYRRLRTWLASLLAELNAITENVTQALTDLEELGGRYLVDINMNELGLDNDDDKSTLKKLEKYQALTLDGVEKAKAALVNVPNASSLREWADNLSAELLVIETNLTQTLLGVDPTAPVATGYKSSNTFGDIAAVDPAMPYLVKFGGLSWKAPIIDVWQPLKKLPVIPVSNSWKVKPNREYFFDSRADVLHRMLLNYGNIRDIKGKVAQAMAGQTVAQAPPPVGVDVLQSIEALRVKTPIFGHNAPPQPKYETIAEDRVIITDYEDPTLRNTWGSVIPDSGDLEQIALDGVHDKIMPGSRIVVEYLAENDPEIVSCQVKETHPVSMGVPGAVTRVTLLTLTEAWLTNGANGSPFDSTDILRQTTVYAQPESLALAEQPLGDDVQGNMLELAQLYQELEPGRWLIVTGERTDIAGVSGLIDSEPVILDAVLQDVQKLDDLNDLPGDRLHSFLRLVGDGLTYSYKRDTVTIYGNVVKATHGETRSEVLGSGDGSRTLQQFGLSQSPLTYLAAPTAAGAESTLEVRVNDIKWGEAGNLAALTPTDRRFISQTDNENQTTIIFGDGEHGARLPTGVENVKAVYRTGLGKAGNVKARQISLLATKPLGVKSVINPLPASGGADRENQDQARRNVPLVLMALDRLVSVQDYADFTRTFAGIGKASAVRLSDGRQALVHLTIAGADDIRIDMNSDLYRNLVWALRRNGEPYQPFRVDLRELVLLVISARVCLRPDYLWESVAPEIRAALMEAFSFERRELGQDVLYSEVVSTIQAMPGVAYVDLDILDGVDERRLQSFLETGQDPEAEAGPSTAGESEPEAGEAATPEEEARQLISKLDLKLKPRIKVTLADRDPDATGGIRPAQLALLTPEVRSTLMLEEIIV